MKKDEQAVRLTASEFLASGRNGLNQQVANARWQLMLAVRRKVPEFFERLREECKSARGALAPRRTVRFTWIMHDRPSEAGSGSADATLG